MRNVFHAIGPHTDDGNARCAVYLDNRMLMRCAELSGIVFRLFCALLDENYMQFTLISSCQSGKMRHTSRTGALRGNCYYDCALRARRGRVGESGFRISNVWRLVSSLCVSAADEDKQAKRTYYRAVVRHQTVDLCCGCARVRHRKSVPRVDILLTGGGKLCNRQRICHVRTSDSTLHIQRLKESRSRN